MRFVTFLLLLVPFVGSAGELTFTTKGYIDVTCDGAHVSYHTVETEATESAFRQAMANGGKADCTLIYPTKTLKIDVAVEAPTTPPPVIDPDPTPTVGQAIVRWTWDGLMTDGSEASFSKFTLSYSRDPNNLWRKAEITDPLQREFVVTPLDAGTWLFEMTVTDAQGRPSAVSNRATKIVQ